MAKANLKLNVTRTSPGPAWAGGRPAGTVIMIIPGTVTVAVRGNAASLAGLPHGRCCHTSDSAPLGPGSDSEVLVIWNLPVQMIATVRGKSQVPDPVPRRHRDS